MLSTLAVMGELSVVSLYVMVSPGLIVVIIFLLESPLPQRPVRMSRASRSAMWKSLVVVLMGNLRNAIEELIDRGGEGGVDVVKSKIKLPLDGVAFPRVVPRGEDDGDEFRVYDQVVNVPVATHDMSRHGGGCGERLPQFGVLAVQVRPRDGAVLVRRAGIKARGSTRSAGSDALKVVDVVHGDGIGAGGAVV